MPFPPGRGRANLDGKIAVGDSATVPAGKYANQALASAGLYTNADGADGEYAASIADKVALADKVGTAAKYVSTGDCAAGFVYSSDIYRYDGIEEAFVCPDDSHSPSCIPAPCPLPARMPRKRPSSWSSALPIRMRRRFGPSTVLSSLIGAPRNAGEEVARSSAWRIDTADARAAWLAVVVAVIMAACVVLWPAPVMASGAAAPAVTATQEGAAFGIDGFERNAKGTARAMGGQPAGYRFPVAGRLQRGGCSHARKRVGAR